jgi:hypothetical protein
MSGNGLLDALGGAGGLAQMARELGIDEKTAMAGAAALLPMVMGGFQKQAAASPQGLEGLAGMLGQMGGGNLLDAVLAPKPTPVDQGNAVLGQIFGSKDVSRAVADRASAASGVGSDILRQMLPMIAMAAAGMMAKQASANSGGGGLGGLVGQVLGGLTGGGQQSAGGLGALAQMLDANRDGNPLDDIMRMMNR